jgi:hypothetical protein
MGSIVSCIRWSPSISDGLSKSKDREENKLPFTGRQCHRVVIYSSGWTGMVFCHLSNLPHMRCSRQPPSRPFPGAGFPCLCPCCFGPPVLRLPLVPCLCPWSGKKQTDSSRSRPCAAAPTAVASAAATASAAAAAGAAGATAHWTRSVRLRPNVVGPCRSAPCGTWFCPTRIRSSGSSPTSARLVQVRIVFRSVCPTRTQSAQLRLKHVSPDSGSVRTRSDTIVG